MNIYYLLGGRFNDNNLIYLDILKETKSLKVLFIDEANISHEKNFLNFKEQFPFFKEISLYQANIPLEKQIEDNDIIYLNGGRTEILYDFCQKNHFKDIVLKYDKIYIGTSAGAIIFFKEGYGDKNAYYDNLKYHMFDFTLGLGIFDYIFCPHYQKEGILSFNDEIKKKKISGIALTDGALIKIKKNKLAVIKEKGASSYYLDKEEDYTLKKLEELELD